MASLTSHFKIQLMTESVVPFRTKQSARGTPHPNQFEGEWVSFGERDPENDEKVFSVSWPTLLASVPTLAASATISEATDGTRLSIAVFCIFLTSDLIFHSNDLRPTSAASGTSPPR